MGAYSIKQGPNTKTLILYVYVHTLYIFALLYMCVFSFPVCQETILYWFLVFLCVLEPEALRVIVPEHLFKNVQLILLGDRNTVSFQEHRVVTFTSHYKMIKFPKLRILSLQYNSLNMLVCFWVSIHYAGGTQG